MQRGLVGHAPVPEPHGLGLGGPVPHWTIDVERLQHGLDLGQFVGEPGEHRAVVGRGCLVGDDHRTPGFAGVLTSGAGTGAVVHGAEVAHQITDCPTGAAGDRGAEHARLACRRL